MFKCSKFPGLQKSFDVLQFWADPGSCFPSAYIMISSTVTINTIKKSVRRKKQFLASLQQKCNEYLYLNINKSKLVFLLQKSSGDFWVIWLMFSIFSMFSMLTMFSKLIPYSSIRDGSTWSKFGAREEHGDVFLFSNLGALWFSENRAQVLDV